MFVCVQLVQHKLEARRPDVSRLSRPHRPQGHKVRVSGSEVAVDSESRGQADELKAVWQTVWSVCLARTDHLERLLKQVTLSSHLY